MKRGSSQRKRQSRPRSGIRCRLQLERLEDRHLLTAYLPDTFVEGDTTPIATSFNQGEQLFFRGTSGDLQFGFGQSALANQYESSYWDQQGVNSVVGVFLAPPVGTPSLSQTVSAGGTNELHATWRTAGGKIMDVNADSWFAYQLLDSNVASDPTAVALHGGRQIMYIGSDQHLHMAASIDHGSSWLSFDVHSFVGLTSNDNVAADAGVAAMQVGDTEYYITRRLDGDLNVISLRYGSWSYQKIDSASVSGFVPPIAGPDGALQAISYDDVGHVDWIFYQDANHAIRGLWSVAGGAWHTAALSASNVAGAPASAYENATSQLSVAYFDDNGHVHLLQQTPSTWRNFDYQGTGLNTLPLAKLNAPATPTIQAAGTLALTGGALTISAAASGAANGARGNSTQLVLGDAANSAQAAGTLNFTGGAISISGAAGSVADGAAGNGVSFVFQNAAGIAQATGVLTLHSTAGTIQISAAAGSVLDGTAGNIDVVLQAAGSTGIASFTGGVLTVNVAAGDTVANIAAAINADARFNAVALTGGGSNTAAGDLTSYASVTSGGSNGATSASYNSGTNVVTVGVAVQATMNQIASSINSLAEFNASVVAGGSTTYSHTDNATYSSVLSGGNNGSTTASYRLDTNTITVGVALHATISQIAVAINSLTSFNASVASGGATTYARSDNATYSAFLSGGVNASAYIASGPSLYEVAYPVGNALPGLHIVYGDEANHVQNFAVNGQGSVQSMAGNYSPLFDATAFMEGYHRDFGYGVVNAARAVAYALGSDTALTGGGATSWNLALIHAADAWTQVTGANSAVFLLDSGVDPANLDLRTLSGVNSSSSVSADDTNGHGTAMAGIIAAASDGSGISGVAYNAQVVPIKVGDSEAESEATVVAGLDAVAAYTLPGGSPATRVVDFGFGAAIDSTQPEQVLIQLRDKMEAYRNGMVFVAPAGNREGNQPDFPARFNAGFGIVAGALNASSERWSASNGASQSVGVPNYLLAPGVGVAASALVGSSGDDHNTANADGTSAAAAHIAGVVALMLEANPALTPREVENILIASADPVTQEQVVSPPSYSASSLYWATA